MCQVQHARLIVGALALLLPSFLAHSAGLGDLTLLSSLGEPLDARIEIVSSFDEVELLTGRVASPDAFRQAGIEFSPVLTGARSVVERRGGKTILRVTTASSVYEPFLPILVELEAMSGRLVRQYNVLPSPPTEVRLGTTPPIVSPALPWAGAARAPSAASAAAPSYKWEAAGRYAREKKIHDSQRLLKRKGVVKPRREPASVASAAPRPTTAPSPEPEKTPLGPAAKAKSKSKSKTAAKPAPEPESNFLGDLFGFGGGANRFLEVRVFYGTDRERSKDVATWRPYGSRRSDAVKYGWCDVTIPTRKRAIGEIPRPWFESAKGDPQRHFVLARSEELEEAAFVDALRSRLADARNGAMLVFVHGYNVTFEGAAFRTAQIANDLDFPGPAVFFSWPSEGDVEDYGTDYDSVRWAAPHLERFLEDLAARTDAKQIYLIAHSMGNQVAPQALISLLTKRQELRLRFRELILAAPDIDAKIFRRDVAPFFKEAQIGVTLYASSNDRALIASRKIRGDYARAGDLYDGPVIEAGIETIDASDVHTDFVLEHSYFGDSASILADIYYLVSHGLRASQRHGLREMTDKQGKYWKVINRPVMIVKMVIAGLVLALLLLIVRYEVHRRRQRASLQRRLEEFWVKQNAAAT